MIFPGLQRSKLIPFAVSMLLPPPTAITAPHRSALQKAAPSSTTSLGGSACTLSKSANSTCACVRLFVTRSTIPAFFTPSSQTISALSTPSRRSSAPVSCTFPAPYSIRASCSNVNSILHPPFLTNEAASLHFRKTPCPQEQDRPQKPLHRLQQTV